MLQGYPDALHDDESTLLFRQLGWYAQISIKTDIWTSWMQNVPPTSVKRLRNSLRCRTNPHRKPRLDKVVDIVRSDTMVRNVLRQA